jgi:hypothetical protein
LFREAGKSSGKQGTITPKGQKKPVLCWLCWNCWFFTSLNNTNRTNQWYKNQLNQQNQHPFSLLSIDVAFSGLRLRLSASEQSR